jgi:signal transduction histidine kinase/CheY-like chemotaxis protein
MIDDKAYIILLHSLLDNILHYADSPKKFASYLCQEIKSIIGIKVVAIASFDQLSCETELMGICPTRKLDFLNTPEFAALSILKSEIKEINYFDLQSASHKESEILNKFGFSDCMIVPLMVGSSMEGQIFLFDLFEKSGIDRIIETFSKLSGLSALVIRNSKMFHNLERMVELRTMELEMKNKELEENENLLKQQNEEYAAINEELNETNAELHIAKEKAQESDRLKTAFLQNMSHEIRTPMNAIMGFSELLVNQYNNKPKLEHYTQIIQQRCSDLLELINEILDIAKIESGQLPVNLEECHLPSLFHELNDFFMEYRKKINKQRINFTTHPDCTSANTVILTDKIKLKQIFINLISNSFKFTDSGRIEIGCRQDHNQHLSFYVSDTGIGIPQEQLGIIFERFAQVYHGPSKFYGGTGLGLSIVKGLVELLNGQIKVESELGKGSTFTFAFPYNSVTLNKDRNEESHRDQNTYIKGTILIVEDDFYNAEYIKEILEEYDVKTFYAGNGKDAFRITKEQSPDLVLLDIRLPDISGYELAKQIRKEKPGIKIIAQTAYASASDRQKAIHAGCDEYISKPLKNADLVSKMSKLLKEKKV